MHDAMLADTEDSDGTGTEAAVPGLRICAKTGTAQVQDVHNMKTGQTTWFASFAPYEQAALRGGGDGRERRLGRRTPAPRSPARSIPPSSSANGRTRPNPKPWPRTTEANAIAQTHV